MIHEKKGDFCDGESEEHCGCLENEAALCKAVWEHINPKLRAFMQSYQKYISKTDVHELLDQLIVSNDSASSEDTCGGCHDAHEGGVDVHTIVIA
jgi:hypothetical protein